MTLRTASFGLLGHARQNHLPGTDTGLLPGADGLEAPPHPGALTSSPYAPRANGTEAVLGGLLTATTTGYGTEAERTVFDVAGPWNSVKNAAVAADGGADLAFLGFVHVDAALGLASPEGSKLAVVGAKRGNLATGGGADRIDLEIANNAWGWSGEFRISTGAGNDEVRIAPLDAEAAAAAGDATFAPDRTNWLHPDHTRDTVTWAELGDGNDLFVLKGESGAKARGGDGADRILLGDGASTAHGGAWNDSIVGGKGADLLSGDDGDDTVEGGGGEDSIWGGAGGDSLSGGGGTDTLAGGGGDDTLAGGGGGFDVVFYPGLASGYEVVLSDDTRTATVRDLDPSDGDEGTDALVGIERLQFADRATELPALGPGVRGFVFYAGGDNGRSLLWVTDGTAAGTRPVEDIETGPSGAGWGGGYGWFSLGDGRALVFNGGGYSGGADLWVTDGTAPGTTMVKSIRPGTSGPSYGGGAEYFFGPVALGEGRALFASGSALAGVDFWVTDGTAAGTTVLKRFGPGGATMHPSAVAALDDGRALFVAHAFHQGDGLWVTDGTAAGTAMVATLNRGPGYEYRYDFTALGDGRALFSGYDGIHGHELWITDGTAAGTAMVEDLSPGLLSGYPGGFAALGDGRALFAAYDGTHGHELWITDGTAAGTAMVKDIAPQNYWDGPAGLTPLGDGRALFSANDGTHGRELWITDGTAAGTAMVKDINPASTGPYDSGGPAGFTALGDGRALFAADDGAHGHELWITDGTAAGTAMVKDIEPGNDGYNWWPGGGRPGGFTPLGDGRALFSAYNAASGRELWITDGTAAGTALLADINPSVSWSDGPRLFTPVVGGASGADPLA